MDIAGLASKPMAPAALRNSVVSKGIGGLSARRSSVASTIVASPASRIAWPTWSARSCVQTRSASVSSASR
jgi:hypothetical protein